MPVNQSVVVNSLLNKFQRNGYKILSVYDGGERIKLASFSNLVARKCATEAIIAIDDSQVILEKNEHKLTLLLILSNDPEEILADYSYPRELEDEIDAITEAFYTQWEDKEWSKND